PHRSRRRARGGPARPARQPPHQGPPASAYSSPSVSSRKSSCALKFLSAPQRIVPCSVVSEGLEASSVSDHTHSRRSVPSPSESASQSTSGWGSSSLGSKVSQRKPSPSRGIHSSRV